MKDIISTLNLVQRLACNLEAEKVSAIERDLALEKLRAIYDLLLGTAAVAEQEPIQDSVIELIEDLVEEVEEFDENDDEVVEEEPAEEEPVTEEPEEEPEESVIELIEDLVDEVEEFANEDEPEEEKEEEEVVAEPATAPKTKLAHSAILALYDDDDDEEEGAPAVEEEVVEEEIEEEVVVDMAELEAEMESAEEEVAEVASAEEKAEEEIVEEQAEDEVVEEKAEESATEPMVESVTEPVVEHVAEPAKVVLGDVLGAEQTTLADRIAATATVDVASAVSASKSLGEMIGLNDKFILLRDLFQNNHDYYEAAIDQLDEFDNIDDAMFFIHDNFQWNPNSEGAKLLVELLSNKLL